MRRATISDKANLRSLAAWDDGAVSGKAVKTDDPAPPKPRNGDHWMTTTKTKLILEMPWKASSCSVRDRSPIQSTLTMTAVRMSWSRFDPGARADCIDTCALAGVSSFQVDHCISSTIPHSCSDRPKRAVISPKHVWACFAQTAVRSQQRPRGRMVGLLRWMDLLQTTHRKASVDESELAIVFERIVFRQQHRTRVPAGACTPLSCGSWRRNLACH